MDTTDTRLQQLTQWVYKNPELENWPIETASADASFRRYFRISQHSESYIVMDAPPEQEDTAPFIDISERLEAAHIPVPHIFAKDTERGFLRLTDLGTQALLSELSTDNVNQLYGEALAILEKLQGADTQDLPSYDHAMLLREMDLFPEWFLNKHLGINLSETQQSALGESMEALAQAALEQPTVFVHRDYHSRNLMLDKAGKFGVIDYQDAVSGPVTYDLVSLLRDCYIQWPQEQVEQWALDFKQKLEDRGTLNDCDNQNFLRWFDLMGVQRHLKAVGIFARLNHRDGKPGYLNDIPRTLSYILDVAPRHKETKALAELLQALDLKNKVAA